MRLFRIDRAATMFPWIQELELFLMVCFMLGTTSAYSLPWWSHPTGQKILKRVERVAETDEEMKQENGGIVRLRGNVTTQGLFLSDKETQTALNSNTTLQADGTSNAMANDHTETFLLATDVESTHQYGKININNTHFNKPLAFIIEPQIISGSVNNTSRSATSVLPETVDVAPSLLNSTGKAVTSTLMNVNYSTPADSVGDAPGNQTVTADSSTSVLNVTREIKPELNNSQNISGGSSPNPKVDSLKFENSMLGIPADNRSTEDTNKPKESDPDEEQDDEYNEPKGIFRKFLDINPDDMEPKETQNTITNGDILTALVFPIFMVALVGVSLYTIHNMRSYFILRFPRLPRRHNQQDPPPHDDDFTSIPLDSIAIPNEQEKHDDEKVEVSIEKEEIEETDLLEPVRPELPIDHILRPKTEDKKHSRSSVRKIREPHRHQDEKEEKVEEKIQHRSSFRNILDEIMTEQNKPEDKLEAKEKECQDLELEQHLAE